MSRSPETSITPPEITELKDAIRAPEYELVRVFLNKAVKEYGESSSDLQNILGASALMLKSFEGKTRGTGVPKALHSFDVALLAMGYNIPAALDAVKSKSEAESFSLRASQIDKSFKYRVPADVIIASLCHDLDEEQLVPIKEITSRFGKNVGRWVKAVTYLKTANTKEGDLQFKMLTTLADDPIAFYIKACDLFSNVRTLDGLKGSTKNGVTETDEQKIARKVDEYWYFVPVLLELRHPYSDFIADELFRRKFPKEYTSTVYDLYTARHNYPDAKESYAQFVRALLKVHPELHAKFRIEFPGIYRMYRLAQEKKRINRSNTYTDENFDSADPVIYVSTEESEGFNHVRTFLRGYSFDSHYHDPSRTTVSFADRDASRTLFTVPMRKGYSLRLYVASPDDSWLVASMPEILFSGKKELGDLFKWRYRQYFQSFRYHKNIERVMREAGRDLITVVVTYSKNGKNRRRHLFLPRDATAVDLATRHVLMNGESAQRLPHMDLVSPGSVHPSGLIDILFTRQQIHITAHTQDMPVEYRLMNAVTPEACDLLANNALLKRSRLGEVLRKLRELDESSLRLLNMVAGDLPNIQEFIRRDPSLAEVSAYEEVLDFEVEAIVPTDTGPFGTRPLVRRLKKTRRKV